MIEQYIGVGKCRSITKNVEKMNQCHCDISLQFVATFMRFHHIRTVMYITYVDQTINKKKIFYENLSNPLNNKKKTFSYLL
jgi:hypothetical protein